MRVGGRTGRELFLNKERGPKDPGIDREKLAQFSLSKETHRRDSREGSKSTECSTNAAEVEFLPSDEIPRIIYHSENRIVPSNEGLAWGG